MINPYYYSNFQMNSQRKSPTNEPAESGGTSRGDNVSDQVCLFIKIIQ